MAQNELEIVEKANPTIKELAIQAALGDENADAAVFSNKTLKEVAILRDNAHFFSGQTLADVSMFLNGNLGAPFGVEDTTVNFGGNSGGGVIVGPGGPGDQAPGSLA